MSLSKEIAEEFFAKLEMAEELNAEQVDRLREVLNQKKKVKSADIVNALVEVEELPV